MSAWRSQVSILILNLEEKFMKKTRTAEELRQLLKQMEQNNHRIPAGVDVNELINDMLHYIGHTDSELRDDLIYGTFVGWEDGDIISPEQMRYMLDTALDEKHLFYGIGENGTDSVFTRTFSSLLIAVALYYHGEIPFLSNEDITNITKTILRYVQMEKDVRGFVKEGGKGWAHSIAHASDMLGNICYYTNHDDSISLLGAIKTMISNSDVVYTTGEDRRLADAFTRILYSAVIDREVVPYKELCDFVENFPVKNEEEAPYILRTNLQNFMKSLLVEMTIAADDEDFAGEEGYEAVNKSILDTIKKIFG